MTGGWRQSINRRREGGIHRYIPELPINETTNESIEAMHAYMHKEGDALWVQSRQY